MNLSTSPLSDSDRELYFDYNATAPLRPEALAAMKPFLLETFANPSSNHSAGRRARRAMTAARRSIAELFGVRRDHVTFTGNGSEANLLALVGTVQALPRSRRQEV